MSPKFEILRSASYWQDFHRRRVHRDRARQERAKRQVVPGSVDLIAGAVPSQPPIITFIPNRPAPVYSLVQNDGSLVLSYDPTCIRMTPPATAGCENLLAARREPPMSHGSLEDSRRRAARIYPKPGPSEDEQLLSRLTACTDDAARPQKHRPMQMHPSHTEETINWQWTEAAGTHPRRRMFLSL
ncbi:hypothetical protein C8R45DRAFT_1106151 [Mycena sanguinolenta]|nr:hypothetical protein C8R45DRAFT_1106151 [Mycena sanguinolenta]